MHFQSFIRVTHEFLICCFFQLVDLIDFTDCIVDWFQVKSIGESVKHLSPEIREISLCDVWLKTAELMIKNVSKLSDKYPFEVSAKYKCDIKTNAEHNEVLKNLLKSSDFL